MSHSRLGMLLESWAPFLCVLSKCRDVNVLVSFRTGCQPEAACTELMPGRWVELGRDEKAFVSPVCVQMGTDFQVEDAKGGFGCSPHPQTFPQVPTPATLSTPQALLSQHLPFIRPVVAEF